MRKRDAAETTVLGKREGEDFLRQFTGFYVPVPSGVNSERVLVVWNRVFKRDARGDEYGVWANMVKQFALDPDMAAVMLDRISVRAHIRAAGGSTDGDDCKNSA